MSWAASCPTSAIVEEDSLVVAAICRPQQISTSAWCFIEKKNKIRDWPTMAKSKYFHIFFIDAEQRIGHFHPICNFFPAISRFLSSRKNNDTFTRSMSSVRERDEVVDDIIYSHP